MTIIYALAVGLSVGAAATVARRIGESDPDGAARAAVQSIICSPLASARSSAPSGILFAPELLRLMGAERRRGPTGSTFARVMIGASGGVTLLFLINAVFRGAGDAADRDARAVDRERHQHHRSDRASSSASGRFPPRRDGRRHRHRASAAGRASLIQIYCSHPP